MAEPLEALRNSTRFMPSLVVVVCELAPAYTKRNAADWKSHTSAPERTAVSTESTGRSRFAVLME